MRYKSLQKSQTYCSVISSLQLISSLMLVIHLASQTTGYMLYNNGVLLKGLKFSEPCPEQNYKFHNPTGNFMCVVPTPKECFKLCQETGCTEWNHMNLVPSGSEEVKRYHRCRCFPEYNMCFYNYVPRTYRDFD
uniref:Uncharacterized protein n=1 Tax=Trichobilharzia regenti TaxID=157069 RepID=A0AA85JRH0_TRIRE|nr:unnamed protein product [Trichobilharzia regenti]